MEQRNIVLTHLPDELSEFVSVDYPPQDEKPVLCIRKALSGASCQYELITACYRPELRSWRSVDGYIWGGNPILGWKNAHRWIQPRN